MCDGIQSAVIHSSTAQWDLGGGELWPAGIPYQPHPIWDSTHPQYQPEIFGFGPDFWATQRGSTSSSRYTFPSYIHPGILFHPTFIQVYFSILHSSRYTFPSYIYPGILFHPTFILVYFSIIHSSRYTFPSFIYPGILFHPAFILVYFSILHSSRYIHSFIYSTILDYLKFIVWRSHFT